MPSARTHDSSPRWWLSLLYPVFLWDIGNRIWLWAIRCNAPFTHMFNIGLWYSILPDPQPLKDAVNNFPFAVLPDSENLIRWLLISFILVQNQMKCLRLCLSQGSSGRWGDKSQQDILAVKGPRHQAWESGISLWRRVITPQVVLWLPHEFCSMSIPQHTRKTKCN